MMQRLYEFILHPLTGKVFLSLLACSYVVYLVTWGSFLYMPLLVPSKAISEHPVETNLDDSISHWTPISMLNATDVDVSDNSAPQLAQASTDISTGKAVKQQGQLPRDKSIAYPLSTVGKIFFTTGSGRDSMCSGTAVVSRNRNVVDTAGHCLYMYGGWSSNVIFCPLYDSGNTPYGCWAARDLEVPSDWIDAKPNDYHHDFGIAIVAPNSQGNLTDLVGGAGWAYNQPVDQPFYAYGYPAGYPFDGQTIQSCEASRGTIWQHGDGNVVSIPCNMTGGSSGGPWFIQIRGNQYLNGHNDFISSIQRGHMFSPYYDDTWYALYRKAQQT
ncbi:MAG: peptidase [Ktedonobacteraceae bacterium]